MTGILAALAEVSISMGALIALLLALGPVWKGRFRPQWRCWVWLLVALRLAVPLNVSLPRAPVRLEVPAPAAEAAVLPAQPEQPEQQTQPASLPQAAEEGPAPRVTAEQALALVWAAGAGVVLAVQLGSYVRFRRRTRRWCTPEGRYEGLQVEGCALLSSPVLVGLVRSRILLPEGVEGERRAFALAHEAMHARRRDLWYQLLLVWVCALHWFNPLVWLLRRAAERDLEIACDAAVLAGKDRAWRQRYGRALLSFVPAGGPAPLTSSFAGGARGRRERFSALMQAGRTRRGRAALALVLCACLLGGGLVACTAEPQESPAPAESQTPAVESPAPAEETGTVAAVVHGVDAGARRILYTEDDGAVGEDSPWQEAEVDAEAGDLEELERQVGLMSSWGLTCKLTFEDGRVTAIQTGELADGSYYVGRLDTEEGGDFFTARVYELDPDTRQMTRAVGEQCFRLAEDAALTLADGTVWTGDLQSFLEDFARDEQALREEGRRYQVVPSPYVLTLRAQVSGGVVTALERMAPPEK